MRNVSQRVSTRIKLLADFFAVILLVFQSSQSISALEIYRRVANLTGLLFYVLEISTLWLFPRI